MKYQDNQHFSHHHFLVSSLKLDEGEKINCNGCQHLLFEPFHGCLSCNYYLHDHCLNTPRSIQHPSHPSHPLTLTPTPTYSTRSFTCNACGSEGKAFSFGCASCEFDLHAQCASLPIRVVNENHPHELRLIFGSPDNNYISSVSCNACRGTIEGGFWRYYCADCDFSTHINCVKGKEGAREDQLPKDNHKTKTNPNVSAQQAYYDAQREIMETHLANKLELQALENAGDYIGSSYTKYRYY